MNFENIDFEYIDLIPLTKISMDFEYIDFEACNIFDPTLQGPLDPAIAALLDQVDWKTDLPPVDTTRPTGNAFIDHHQVLAAPIGDFTGLLEDDWQNDLNWLLTFDPTAKRRESNVMQEMGQPADANLLRFHYGPAPAQVPFMMATPSPDAYHGVPNWTAGFSDCPSGEPSGSRVPTMHGQAHFAASEGGSSTSALKSTSSNARREEERQSPQRHRSLGVRSRNVGIGAL